MWNIKFRIYFYCKYVWDENSQVSQNFIQIKKVVLIKIFECVWVGLSDGVEVEIKLTTFVFDPGWK